MSADAELARLEAALMDARRIAEAAAQRAIVSIAPADYQAALETAAEVDRIWQQYGRRWRLIHGAARPPTA